MAMDEHRMSCVLVVDALPGDQMVVLTRYGLTIVDTDTGERIHDLPAEQHDLGGLDVQVASAPDRQYFAACGTQEIVEEGARDIISIDWVSVWEASQGRLFHATAEREFSDDVHWSCAVAVGPTMSMADCLMD